MSRFCLPTIIKNQWNLFSDSFLVLMTFVSRHVCVCVSVHLMISTVIEKNGKNFNNNKHRRRWVGRT